MPLTANPISAYRTNADAVGDYTFSFQMENPIQNNPKITIIFPPVYSGIVESACVVDLIKGIETYTIGNLKFKLFYWV